MGWERVSLITVDERETHNWLEPTIIVCPSRSLSLSTLWRELLGGWGRIQCSCYLRTFLLQFVNLDPMGQIFKLESSSL